MSNITEIYDDIIAGLKGENDYVMQLYFKVTGSVCDGISTDNSLNFDQIRYFKLKQNVEMKLEPYFCFKTLCYRDIRFVGLIYKLPFPLKAKELDEDKLRRLEVIVDEWMKLFENIEVELINLKYVQDEEELESLEESFLYSKDGYDFGKYSQLVESDLNINFWNSKKWIPIY